MLASSGDQPSLSTLPAAAVWVGPRASGNEEEPVLIVLG